MAEIISRDERRARKREFHAALRAECDMILLLIERRPPRNLGLMTTAGLCELVVELREAKRRWLRSVMESSPGPSNRMVDDLRHRRWAEAGVPLPPIHAVRVDQ